MRARLAVALAVLAAGLAAVGCGDDDSGDETTTTPSISIPSVTAPTAPATPTEPSGGVAPETTTDSGAGSGAGGGGRYDPSKPDTPENDKPPPAGSPQESFEKFCEQNPAACG